MSDSVLRILYFVGAIAQSAIRVVYTKQHKQKGTKFDRQVELDGILGALPSLGMLIVPLLYVLTSWLRSADYRLPTRAGWRGGLRCLDVVAMEVAR